MELSSIIFLVLVFIGLILTIFFVVKDFEKLGVVHSICFVLLFIFSITFLIMSAKVHQIRIRDIVRYDRVKTQNESLQDQVVQLRYGDLTTPTAEMTNVLPLMSEVGRLSIERGRLWRGAVPQQFANNIVDITLPPPVVANNVGMAPATAAEQPVAQENLVPDTIVYVFGETPNAQNQLVPTFYLGEFFVAESQGGTAKLRPTIAPNQNQLQALQSNQFPRWSIYEVMPSDSHVAYAEPGSEVTPDQIYGRMDPQVISTLLSIPLELLDRSPTEMTPQDAFLASVLRQYVFDGQRAPPDAPAEQTWYEIEFLKEHKVQVDSLETRNALEGGYFDAAGRTVDARLKRAAEEGATGNDAATVTFSAGEKVLFPRQLNRSSPDAAVTETADSLIADGVAKLIQPYYVRPLNDYAYVFKQIQLQLNQTSERIELTQREINRTKATEELGQSQIVSKQAERQKLNADLAQLTKELEVVTTELKNVTAQVGDVRKELSNLYQRSQDLYRRLIQVQQAAANVIN